MKWMSKQFYKMIKDARQETFELNGWILITVELAKKFLELNTRNPRSKTPGPIEKYSRDMAGGKWEKNGEAIVISKTGILCNGQHRLNAIIKSGVPVVMYMIFDADNAVIFDVPYKRTCVQILKMKGLSVMGITPSVARTVMNGKVSTSKMGDGVICDYVVQNYKTLKKVESIIKSTIPNCKVKNVGVKAPFATIVYCLLRTGQISEDELYDFFRVFNTDDKCGLKRDISSIKALRHQIMSYPGHGDNLSNRFMEYLYLAIMDFHNGASIEKNYYYPEGGNNAVRLIREVQCMDGICPKAA